jgi:hypothetical protein
LEVAYEDQCVAFDELSDGQGLAISASIFQGKKGQGIG